jgi:hypothetical protein
VAGQRRATFTVVHVRVHWLGGNDPRKSGQIGVDGTRIAVREIGGNNPSQSDIIFILWRDCRRGLEKPRGRA